MADPRSFKVTYIRASARKAGKAFPAMFENIIGLTFSKGAEDGDRN